MVVGWFAVTDGLISLGTFDLTIDGTTHSKVPVDIDAKEFLEKLQVNGDYRQAHKWGSCYGELNF